MKHKRLTLKITLGMLVILLTSFNVFSYWHSNYSPIAFGYGDGLGSTAGEIEGKITEGAVYILEAYGHFLSYMKQLEKSGASALRETEVMESLDQALKALEQAQPVYMRLKEAAEITPYNAIVIGKLKRFDYEGFLEKRGLNPVVYAEVRNYLEKGEVRELYGRIAQDVGVLLEKVRLVKAKMEEGETLPVEETWRANELFMRFLGFGQYTAEVFKALQ